MKIGRYLYWLCLFNKKPIIKRSKQCSIKDRTDNLMTTFFLIAEKKGKFMLKRVLNWIYLFALSEHGKVSSEKTHYNCIIY